MRLNNCLEKREYLFDLAVLEGVRTKNLMATLLFVDFSIHKGKMKQILLAYGFLKETAATIMMLYKNVKVNVRSPDGDTDKFDIVAGVLQGDTLASYLFIICLYIVLRTSIDLKKENGFTLAKKKRAENTPHELLRTQTTPMIKRFWQMPLPKPNPCFMVWNKQQVA